MSYVSEVSSDEAPTVLIVDNNQMSIMRLREVFRKRGFAIEVCEDGDLAVDEYIKLDPELTVRNLRAGRAARSRTSVKVGRQLAVERVVDSTGHGHVGYARVDVILDFLKLKQEAVACFPGREVPRVTAALEL